MIFHVAAYKHVNLVELNPFVGLSNNVFGTLNIVKASIKYNVSKFILISTDKAVRPTNIMGASKRISELILQSHNSFSKSTKFSIVRFGNVLGSSGSVVPKFQKQISEGGPITLTHPAVKRFFMTINEAVQLILEASEMSNGGEVFVLKMGELIKIKDLAIKMINLSGKTIKNNKYLNGDIEIKITGLTSGEKLFEEIVIDKNFINTSNSQILNAKEKFIKWTELEPNLNKLNTLLKTNEIKKIKTLLTKLDIGYSQSTN